MAGKIEKWVIVSPRAVSLKGDVGSKTPCQYDLWRIESLYAKTAKT
jgi:hypothetical protein